MRTITRTGVTLGVVAALALYGVQLVAALDAALGLILTGVLAGLSVAKWLQRDWYGRQFEAGARAGVIACGVSGLSALLYLLGQGPRSLPELAARSQLAGVDLTPLILPLGELGWAGVDMVVIFGAAVLGVVCSALIAQIVGWSKSGRAARVVAQARLAAQALQRVDARGVTAGPRSSTAGPQLYASGAPITSASRVASDWDGLGLPDASSPAAPRSWRSAAPAPQSAPAPRPDAIHRPSDARSANETLSDEARAALSSWEEELDESDGFEGLSGFDDGDADKAETEKARTPTPSGFLTSPPPVKPSNRRKRQDTNDWLC